MEAAPKRATGGGKYEAAWINEFWGDKYGEVRNKWACNCWRWDEAWWSPCARTGLFAPTKETEF